ncbi:MAG: outer membrane protein assembly factor BamB family protein [Planctomycetota bacterium]
MNSPRISTVLRFSAACFAVSVVMLTQCVSADEWPQWRGPNRDGVWRETGIVETFTGPQLELKWRAPISNGYSGPTVADGRVYVTDRLTEPLQKERVLCFDAATGAEVWTHEYECRYAGVGYPDGPRASVTIDDGRAYALGTMGHFRCLDAASGKLLWKKDPGTDYEIKMPIWGIASAPLVEGELVIAQLGAQPDACIVAWDRRTGEERWRALTDGASYSAPVIVEQAGQRVLVCWTADHVVGLDPETGGVHWKHPIPPRRMVINVPTPVVDGDRLFLTAFFDGSYMFRLGRDSLTAEAIWQRHGESERSTDALHSTISTPVILGDHIYGVDSYGELRCLDAATGDRVWEDLTVMPKERWATAHIVQHGERVWLFNELGELIIAKFTPEGFNEISRTKLIQPTKGQLGRGVCWSHPAFAYKHVFARNDSELVCASVAAE